MGSNEPTYGGIPDLRWRLFHEVGWGFLIGGGCGSSLHFLRGLRNWPSGGRLVGAAHDLRVNAPRVAGSWGAFFGISCAFESAMSLARRKEDPWNSVAAGAATWGLLDARLGARAAARSVILGATVVALFQGVYIVFDRNFLAVPQYVPPVPDDPCLPAPAGHRPTPGGFLGIPRQRIVVQQISVADKPWL
ncbi:mitochondrial import inner membrane translocase subunit TIM17-3-like [Phragmites australis]|uniref:mitochondrial import inner membrane translocase subunit TIM17-3-like n=1 Tax=Phragmites australis TaxID=29695 RepID=UPI002D79E380|nr:mitochondrial import inner membrane translocase subunit TIM17-3-like [Phragmites australis]